MAEIQEVKLSVVLRVVDGVDILEHKQSRVTRQAAERCGSYINAIPVVFHAVY